METKVCVVCQKELKITAFVVKKGERTEYCRNCKPLWKDEKTKLRENGLKICVTCNETKVVEMFYPYKKGEKTYISSSCKKCMNSNNKRTKKKNDIRLCKVCKEKKPIFDFKFTNRYFSYTCKECECLKQKEKDIEKSKMSKKLKLKTLKPKPIRKLKIPKPKPVIKIEKYIKKLEHLYQTNKKKQTLELILQNKQRLKQYGAGF